MESGGPNSEWDYNIDKKPDKKTGQPRQRWIGWVREDLKFLGIRDGEQLAKNRESWSGVMEAAMKFQGPE